MKEILVLDNNRQGPMTTAISLDHKITRNMIITIEWDLIITGQHTMVEVATIKEEETTTVETTTVEWVPLATITEAITIQEIVEGTGLKFPLT